MRRIVIGLAMLTVLAIGLPLRADEDPVFSGPQAGEKLPPLPVEGVVGPHAGKAVDLIKQAADKPVLVIFVHQRTRPAFGLARGLMTFASKHDEKLASGVVFLSDDPTATVQWLGNVKRYFPEPSNLAISKEGQEGPGAYGLNRKVTLTILVGKEGKVTDNFALVQPSLQADGPKIGAALGKVLELDEPPTLAQLGAPTAMRMDDPRLERLVRPLLRKDVGKEQVETIVTAVERYLERTPAAKRTLAQFAQRTIASRGFDEMGTEAGREQLKTWAKLAAPRDGPRNRPPAEVNLRPYLAPLINKQADVDQVDAAAKKIEAFLKDNEPAQRTLGRIANTIVDSGKLANYGTPRAQDYLRKWARKYRPQDKEEPKKSEDPKKEDADSPKDK